MRFAADDKSNHIISPFSILDLEFLLLYLLVFTRAPITIGFIPETMIELEQQSPASSNMAWIPLPVQPMCMPFYPYSTETPDAPA